MEGRSYYDSTNRQRIASDDILASQQAYTFNYSTYLPTLNSARIIDIGCSEGIALEWLTSLGYNNIVGVDSDLASIQAARIKLSSKLDESRIVCSDALAYLKGCEDRSVEMVSMFNVIEHIPKEIILEMMAEIRRVLKLDGVFLAQTGNWENPLNIGLFTRDFTHEVMYTKNSLRQMMLISGFIRENVSVNPVRYKTTLRNFPLQLLAPVTGVILKAFALSMRTRIHETSALIYCLAINK